jgi:sigma-B regulation protein RsbU (phosphoserine phosphatase)
MNTTRQIGQTRPGSPDRELVALPARASDVRVLLIADIPTYAHLMREMLAPAKGTKFVVEWSDSLNSGLEGALRGQIDIILLDLALSASQGLESFLKARSVTPNIPIIVLSGLDDEELAVKAVHEGAQDYLVKGEIDRHLLVRSIRYAIERKRVEVALVQTQETYRNIFENTVEGIFQTTPDGKYISANKALARIYGYASVQDLIASVTDIGRKLYVEPNRRTQFIELMEKHDVVTDFESQVFQKDGTIIWISENVRAVRSPTGTLQFYEGTVENITERKLSEEKVRNSEALYHSLVENLPQNIFRKDLSEQFTFANQLFCRTLGRPLEEILGKTDFDFFPAALAAKYQKDDQSIMETGKLFETVEEHQLPGGEKIYVNVVKTPLYDARGQIIGLQGIFWDITERRRAEEKIKKATVELTRSREELRLRNDQMEEDLRMAREIQQAFLPQQYPSFPKSVPVEESALRFVHRYFPTGAVGGDFFNVRALSDTKAGIFICDVMGHGVRSALVTAIVRALVEELTPEANDPGELLGQVNKDLRAILKQSGTPLFTTAFYLIIDLTTHDVTFANAGHPRPMILHRESRKVEFLCNSHRKSDPALGLFDAPVYNCSGCSVQPGDTIILFTDGFFDVERDGELLSPDWLAEEIERRAELPTADLFDTLLSRLKEWSGGTEFADDVCIIGIDVVK